VSGAACGTGGGGTDIHKGILWRHLKKGDHLEELCVDGRTVLTSFSKKWDGRVLDRINLA
jgi:hypothetical protein